MANGKKETKKVVETPKGAPKKLVGLTVRSALKSGLGVDGCQPCHVPS